MQQQGAEWWTEGGREGGREDKVEVGGRQGVRMSARRRDL